MASQSYKSNEKMLIHSKKKVTGRGVWSIWSLREDGNGTQQKKLLKSLQYIIDKTIINRFLAKHQLLLV